MFSSASETAPCSRIGASRRSRHSSMGDGPSTTSWWQLAPGSPRPRHCIWSISSGGAGTSYSRLGEITAQYVPRFWQDVGFDAQAVAAALTASPVCVLSVGGPALAEPVTEALAQAGIRVEAEGNLRVVVTVTTHLRSDLASLNADALRTGSRWLLLKTTSTRPLIGPLFSPGDGPCWECLAFWLRNNRPVEELLRRNKREGAAVGPPDAAIEASVRTASGMGALALSRAPRGARRRGYAGAAVAGLRAGSRTSFEIRSAHSVAKRPQCFACGDPSLMKAVGERPIELAPVEKSHFADGGFRRQTPQSTYEQLRHLVSPLTGPVTRIL